MGWKKALAIVGIVLAVLVVAAGVAVYALSRPATLVPYEDDLAPATRDQQTRIALALSLADVDSSLVVVKDGNAVAMYTRPADGATSADDWQRTVLGAMAPLAGDATTLVAVQYVDEEPSVEWSVATEKVLAFQAGTLPVEDLEAAITKKVH